MPQWELKKPEIDTITGRSITLNLSDADVLRLCEKAGGVGMTVEELLTSFVGDLVDGTYSNGSDERMCASEWFDRCCFAYRVDKRLLRYLIDMDMTDDFLQCTQNVHDAKGEIETKEIELAKLKSLPTKNRIVVEGIAGLKEEIEWLQEEIVSDQEELAETWDAFESWCKDTPHGTLAEETAHVIAWQQAYKVLVCQATDTQPQQQENDFIIVSDPLAP